MTLDLIVACGALLLALISIGLQLFHLRRDPNVPELGDDSWTAVNDVSERVKFE